jgi:hypothetical protein
MLAFHNIFLEIIFFYFLIPIHIKKNIIFKIPLKYNSKCLQILTTQVLPDTELVFSCYPDTELIYSHLTMCSGRLSCAHARIYMFKIVLEWIFILFKRVKKGRHFFFFFFNYFYLLYSKIIIKRYPKLSTFLFMECPKPELTITNMRLL